MPESNALEALSALAHEHRLGVFRLLVRHSPEGLAAGQKAYFHRARCNGLARSGSWSEATEKAA